MVIKILIILSVIILYALLAHHVSYSLVKKKIINGQKWDLNICCGKTDGGGVNVDIVKHQDLPHFYQVDDIYNLPFAEGHFETVLSSHTIEHVDDPKRFFSELQRVGKQVTLIVPPLYDLGAVFNIFEHKWIFLTCKKRHHELPKFIKLPFSDIFHKFLGQRNNA